MASEKKYNYVCIRRKVGDKSIKFYGKTKREAQNKYEAAKDNYYNQAIEYSNMPFDKWANIWLEKYKYGTVRDITYQNTYQTPTKNHIIKHFGSELIKNISHQDLQAFLLSKTKYSKSTLDDFRKCLNGIFSSAVNEKLIPSNPAIGLKTPKVVLDKISKEQQAWTYDQGRIFIEWAKTHPYGLDGIIQLKTGVRRAELLAFPYKVSKAMGGADLKESLLYVNRSVSEVRGGLSFNPCKTAKSRRVIPFDDELALLLKDVPNVTTYRGSEYKNEFLISDHYGQCIYPSNWQERRYKKLMLDFSTHCAENELKIPVLKSHELRHSFGSILYERTKDIVLVSELMGHSDISITVSKYIHQDIDKKRKAISLGV